MTKETSDENTLGDISDDTTVQINGQYIKDFSFENPNSPHSLQTKGEPSIEINIDVGATKLFEAVYEVALTISVKGTDEEKPLFVIELVYAGVFTFSNMTDDKLQPSLLIDCPRLLFPFARSIIANVTSDGGLPPLLLQPVNFAQLFLNSREQ
jgi:preprotein translocase subunit SecB